MSELYYLLAFKEIIKPKDEKGDIIMWVVIHKEKMSIFSGYETEEKAIRACENLNSVKRGKYYMEWVEIR